MKKIIYSLFAVAAVTFAAGCTKEADRAGADGATAQVSFNVRFGGLSTKAFADGQTVDELVALVYDAETGAFYDKVSAQAGAGVAITGGKATFEPVLVKGQTYDIVFWAQKKGTGYYTFDTAAKTLKVNYKGLANDETRDAFYKVVTVKVTDNQPQTVELSRPFAQINVLTTRTDVEAAAALNLGLKASAMTIKDVPDVLNLLDGTVAGSAEAAFTVNDIDEAVFGQYLNEGYTYVAMNYILAADGNNPNKELSFDVELAGTQGSNASVTNTTEVSNVPVNRNFRTNLIGDVFTTQTTFNIVVTPGFGGDDNIFNLENGESTETETTVIDVDALDKEANAVFFDEAGEFTTTLSIQVGDVVDFSVLKSNAGAAAESYALDSEDYATLSDGVLTATAEGTALVTLHFAEASITKAVVLYPETDIIFTVNIAAAENPEPQPTKVEELPYEISFLENAGDFMIYNVDVPEAVGEVWKQNTRYGMVATGYVSSSKVNYASDAWLISQQFDLTGTTKPVLTFAHALNFFSSVDVAKEEAQVLVKEEGGEWTVLNATYPTTLSYTYIDNTIDLSEYIGKKIQIAFHYTSTATKAGTYEVKNFKLEDVQEVVVETVAAPVFSVEAGEVEKGTEVIITTETEGAAIYYTLTATTGPETLYEGPIVIEEDVTITAVAKKEGMNDSETVTASYTVKTGDNPDDNGDGTLENPYNVEGVIAYIDGLDGAESDDVYVKGIITSLTNYLYGPTYNTASFFISTDGTTDGATFEAYSCYYLGGSTSKWISGVSTQVEVGQEVVIYGKVTFYSKSSVYETVSKQAQLYSINGKTADAASLVVSNVNNIPAEGVTDNTVSINVYNAEGYSASVTADGTVVTSASISDNVITYSVSKNEGVAREGSIVVTLKKEGEEDVTATITVSQAGAGQEEVETVTVTADKAYLAANQNGEVGDTGVISYTNNSSYTGSVTELRIYKGSKFTVSAVSGYKITKIEITCSASGTTKYGPGCFGAVDGYSYNGTVGTWEGSESSVEFTASSAQVRVVELSVSYIAE